ncbi:hypothetical protein SAMN02910370_02812 [Lachnospiraceae bacterium XPB1003]|nr:hypothetical protein SAMN02910370_02812 [Lachnospiraceae bacterium XPB1003]
MDIKKTIDDVVAKVKNDPDLLKKFQDDPVKTIESLSGIDIPDGMEDKIVAGVKSALSGNTASGLIDKVKNLL